MLSASSGKSDFVTRNKNTCDQAIRESNRLF